MKEVNGINVQNFIEFVRHQSNIEVFHCEENNFNEFTREMCDAVAKYCGHQIRSFSGRIFANHERKDLYDFGSGFKNVEEVCFCQHTFYAVVTCFMH